jgi:hypothetical protein
MHAWQRMAGPTSSLINTRSEMTTITANGGAERFWRMRSIPTTRAVLCRNGVMLIRYGSGGWKPAPALWKIEQDSRWEADTRVAIRAATTRTSRSARREGGK